MFSPLNDKRNRFVPDIRSLKDKISTHLARLRWNHLCRSNRPRCSLKDVASFLHFLFHALVFERGFADRGIH